MSLLRDPMYAPVEPIIYGDTIMVDDVVVFAPSIEEYIDTVQGYLVRDYVGVNRLLRDDNADLTDMVNTVYLKPNETLRHYYGSVIRGMRAAISHSWTSKGLEVFRGACSDRIARALRALEPGELLTSVQFMSASIADEIGLALSTEGHPDLFPDVNVLFRINVPEYTRMLNADMFKPKLSRGRREREVILHDQAQLQFRGLTEVDVGYDILVADFTYREMVPRKGFVLHPSYWGVNREQVIVSERAVQRMTFSESEFFYTIFETGHVRALEAFTNGEL